MMSHALQSIFTDAPLIAAGLVFFLAAFVSIVAQALLARKDRIAAAAHLPFENEEVHHE